MNMMSINNWKDMITKVDNHNFHLTKPFICDTYKVPQFIIVGHQLLIFFIPFHSHVCVHYSNNHLVGNHT